MDIDATRLEQAHGIVQSMIDQRKLKAKVVASTEPAKR